MPKAAAGLAILVLVGGGLELACSNHSGSTSTAAAPSSSAPNYSHIVSARYQAPRRNFKAVLQKAKKYTQKRDGIVGFSFSDGQRFYHSRGTRRFVSASVVKAMLLVGYLRKSSVKHRKLTSGEKAFLSPMIQVSDNNAANTTYNQVGDKGLYQVARRVKMRHFDVYGYWASAQLTAVDQNRLFNQIFQITPKRHRSYAKHLLRSIVSYQRWGIPPATRYRIYFKGGWRGTGLGQLVHQSARFNQGDVRSLTVLTDGNPSMLYGEKTIEGLARIILKR